MFNKVERNMKIFSIQKYFLSLTVLMLTVSCLLAQPLGVTIVSFSNASCNSVCDGGITASASGGASPYTYQWVDLSIPSVIAGETDSSITGLCAGDFAVVVTDNSGSVDSATVTITEPPIFISSISGQTNVSCATGCDGTATVTPVGGTSPYTYLWLDNTLTPLSPPQTDSTATNLCALVYSVQISDANGCTSVSSATITEPAPLNISLSAQTAAQCIVCDGTATVSASGGTTPYSYLWNDASTQTTPAADSLCTSTYAVTVTDSNSCSTTLNVVIVGPGGYFSSIDTTVNSTCAGTCDGQASVNGSGGNTPYTYAWVDQSISDTIAGATDSNLTSLCASSYNAIITDNNGCISTTAVFTLTDPPLFTATVTDSSNVTCFGDTDGTATVTIINGISPYNYTWSSGGTTTGSTDTTNTETGLVSGIHSINVIDSNGCLAIDSVSIATPTLLIATITNSVNTSCGGICDGSATVTTTGGTPPYNYLWDAGNTPTDSATNGLCAGLHTVNVTDTNGCGAFAPLTISEPPILSAPISGNNPVSCYGVCDGDATVFPTGGVAPYTVLWSNGDTTSTSDSLCAGSYMIIVEDSNNCTAQDSVSISEPLSLAIDFTDSSAICEPLCNGYAIATGLGGTSPYSYLWINGDTVPLADSLCGGIQQLIVTDANGCTAFDSVIILMDTSPITANAGADVDVCMGESTTLSASGGLSYSWSPATELSCDSCPNPEITPSSTGTYTLIVQNIACVDSDQVVITVTTCLAGPIPEIISPNGDGTNDILDIPNIEQFPDNKITIFNQWGDVVFNTNQYHNVNNNWSGKTNDGKSLPDGTYFYILQLITGEEPISGHVLIYR